MMNARNLFAFALGLDNQWEIADFEISEDPSRLDIQLDFTPGEKFACPHCAQSCPIHDTEKREWQHLNFWQYHTFLTARVPRIKCPEHGIKFIQVPWARRGSGFTLMMEHFIMMLISKMPVDSVAQILKVTDTRLWRVVNHYVTQAHDTEDWSGVRDILVDETSTKKGHKYATIVVDAATRKLLWMGEGRKSEVVGQFVDALKEHGGDPDQIGLVGIDMSTAYRKGVREYFPKAGIVFDRFHIMKNAGEAVDKIRKDLCKEHGDLKRHRWAFVGNEWNKSEKQQAIRKQYSQEYPKLGRAIGLREALQDVLESRDWDSFKWWLNWALRSRLEPFVKLGRSLKKCAQEIKNYFSSGLNSGAIESVNSRIQLAKRMARGFRNFSNFKATCYLRASSISPVVLKINPQ